MARDYALSLDPIAGFLAASTEAGSRLLNGVVIYNWMARHSADDLQLSLNGIIISRNSTTARPLVSISTA